MNNTYICCKKTSVIIALTVRVIIVLRLFNLGVYTGLPSACGVQYFPLMYFIPDRAEEVNETVTGACCLTPFKLSHVSTSFIAELF